jgi:hypothetical protein
VNLNFKLAAVFQGEFTRLYNNRQAVGTRDPGSWLGVHSGRPARPGPSPKRSVLFEFRAGPARLNFGPCRAGPRPGP